MNKKLGQKFDTASGVVRLSSAAVSSTSTAVPPPPPPQSSQCVVYLQNYIAPAYYKALQNKSFLGLTTCQSHHTQLCENISSNKGCSRRGVIIEQARNFTKIFKIKQKNLTPTFYLYERNIKEIKTALITFSIIMLFIR